MNGLSFSATTEKRKGILLDPRTKLILLLTITTLMFSTSNEGIMNIVKPCLSLVPFALILSERRFKTAGKYLVLYAVCFILERIALTSLSGLLSFIVLAVTSIMTRFAPGIMTGAYLISSTSISEFIGAMERIVRLFGKGCFRQSFNSHFPHGDLLHAARSAREYHRKAGPRPDGDDFRYSVRPVQNNDC